MEQFAKALEGLRLHSKKLGGNKHENCQLANLQSFQILILVPFIAIKGQSYHVGSGLCNMFGAADLL